MNKYAKNIIILFCILLLLTAGNILLKYYIEKNDLQNIEENIQSTYISNYSVDTLEKIEIKNENGELILIQENGVWYLQDDKNVELDQGVVSELAYMLTHVLAEREVRDTEDIENIYGIASPSSIITIYIQGMVEQKFILGDKAPVENQYYMQSSVFKKVYTVDMAYYIYGNIKLEDLLELKGANISHADIKEISIKNSLNEEFVIRRTLPENDITLCYWEFIKPFCHDIDTAVMYGSEKYTGMITTIVELTGDKVIAIGEENQQKYGLDNPIFHADILSISGDKQSFAIGEYGDEENYSLKYSNDNNIYLISKDSVPFVDYSAYFIAESNLNLINIDKVNKIIIDLPSLSINIYIEHVTDGSKDDEVGENIITIDSLDENMLSVSNIQNQKLLFYQYIATIKIDDLFIERTEIGEKIGSIEFVLDSEYQSEFTINYYEYNISHYIAKKNGEEASYLVNKDEIDKLVQRYSFLLAGELSN